MIEENKKEMFNLQEGIRKKTLADGREYSVRIDRHRYFFPDEWRLFVKELDEKNRNLFEFLINTGARFDEAIHIRPVDFDERDNVRIWKVKVKAKKKETVGQPRTIPISSEFSKKIRRYCNDFKRDEFIFPKSSLQQANQLMKRIVKKIGLKDPYNFSTHNVRKTHGMYLKALGIGMGEICTRLGHDAETYIKHYGSADIFTEKDMRGIRELMGDLYLRRRQNEA